MLRRLKKRTKEDDGNAVIILGLMLIMALLLVGGLLLDVSKAYQMKSSYIDATKKATQAAIMKQSTTGHLKPEAAGEAVRVYEHIARPSVVNPDGYFSKCSEYDENDVVLEVYFGHDNTSEKFGSIKRSKVSENATASEIVNEMDTLFNEHEVAGKKYTSIELVVVEGTENVLLPTAFSITQNKEGADKIKCQLMTVGAKADIFTEMSNDDED